MKELLLIEGSSALGQYESARDQTGVKLDETLKNVGGSNTMEILDKPEFKALMNVLGVGDGKDYKITALIYDESNH